MRRLGLSALIACVALTCTGVAKAKPVNLAGTAKRVALKVFAGCTLEKQRALAIEYALTAALRQERRREYDKLGDFDCAERAHASFDSLRVTQMAFSGAVAEELIAGRDMAVHEAAMQSVAALPRRPEPTMANYRPGEEWSKKSYERNLPRIHGEWALDIIAECTVRKSPSVSRALFATAPDSAEEQAAMNAIVPHVAGCLSSGQVRMNPDQLRLALASNYLRLAVAAVPGLKESLM